MVGTVGDFGSHCTGSTTSAEALFTGNGSTQFFSHTLAHNPLSPNSVLLTYSSQNVAGDYPGYAYNNGINGVPPSIYPNAPNWGELGTPAYYGASATGSGSTATYTFSSTDVPTFPPIIAVGTNVNVSGCASNGFNGTWTVASIPPTAPALSFTAVTGTGSLAASTAQCKVKPIVLFPDYFEFQQLNPTASGSTVTMPVYATLPTGASGSLVKITGCNNSSYNGTWTVSGTQTGPPVSFTYTDGGLGGSTGTTGCKADFYDQVSEGNVPVANTVTVITPQIPPGLAVNDWVGLNDCMNTSGSNLTGYWGVWQVAGISGNSFTFVASTGSLGAGFCQVVGTSLVNYNTGAANVRFMAAPASGAAWTANYLYNGWMSGGTGLMDESGGNGRIGPAAPSPLSQTPGGSLGATTYYVEASCNDPVSANDPTGETTLSNESSFAVSASNVLVVPAPSAVAGIGNCSGTWNVYVSNTAGGGIGQETLQQSAIANGTPWTEPTSGLISGTAAPFNSNATVGSNGYCVEGANSSYSAYFPCVSPYTGQNHPAPNACGGTSGGGGCQFAIDSDAWIAQFAGRYFSNTRTNLRAYSNVPYLGLDSTGSGGVPAYSGFLQGEGAYVDATFNSMPYYWSPTITSPSGPAQALQYLTQYQGDIPFLVFAYPNCDQDSSYYCFVNTAGVSRFQNQATKGQAWYNEINWLLTTLSFNSDYQFVGSSYWSWQDFSNLNQGLVSVFENAYDGQSAAVAAGMDQFGVPTGGESFNWGNSITPISQANAIWLGLLTGQIRVVSGTTTTSGTAH